MTGPPDVRRPGAYDATRPLVLAYLRASLLPSPGELAEAREQLALVAQLEGYTLGAVFTEEAETAPASFSALVDAVRHYEAKGIVVPSAEHLAVLGAQPSLSEYLQRVTGVPLIVVQVLQASPTASADLPTSAGSTSAGSQPRHPARPTPPETPWLFLPP
jgi:hypothetical protein